MSSKVEFKDNSITIKTELNKKSLNWIEEVCGEIERQVQDNTRSDSGDTKRNWKHEVDKDKGEGVIGNRLQNAIWEELGTGEYAVNKDGKDRPWYVPVEDYLGHKKPTFNGKIVIVHAKDGTAFYKTNGKKPTRALTKAFETVRPKALKRAEEIFGRIGK